MKLNEYIYQKFMNMSDPETMSDYFTEADVEKWIIDWYNASFKEVGCNGPTANVRQPPLWLANWRTVNE